MKKKVLVVGWDGATFDIIKPLVDAGRMPNMAEAMKNGVWGRFDSTTPPLTPVAWTSIITGVNPGKHGIFDAVAYDSSTHKFGFVNSTNRRVKPVWSLLSEKGKTVGAMNVPVTFPADEVNGFVIPGMLSPFGVPDFMYPPSLKAEVEKKLGPYIIECRQMDNPAAYLKAIIEMIDYRERAALYLMEHFDLDFFFLVFMASDRVQHFFWKYLDPKHPEHVAYGEAIATVYERLDSALGSILRKSGPETSLMMVSDHGAGPLYSTFFMNNWLMKQGYLKLHVDPAQLLRSKKPSWIKTGVARSVKRMLPSSVLDKIRRKERSASQDELSVFSTAIDWDSTIAFSEGLAGGIYINTNKVGPAEYDGVLAQITRKLYDVVDPNGKKVIESVFRRDEVYSGDETSSAPDLTVICSPGYQIISPNEILYFNQDYEDILFLPHKWSGRHEQYGIFLLKGEGVRQGAEVNGVRIIDATPMLLYMSGEAIPEYMDGRVQESAFEGRFLSSNPIKHVTEAIPKDGSGKKLSQEEEKEIADRLKGLGYLE